MTVPGWLWAASFIGLMGILVLDLVIVDRRPHPFTPREALRWVVFYVALAAVFAAFVWVYFGATFAGQFVTGYLTEYSLSVDNLFVFLIIMTSFAVPAALQHRVLLIGIVIALVLRGLLIVLGAELIARFEATFFVFGLFLLFTAWRVWSQDLQEPGTENNAVVRWVSRRVPTSTQYDGRKLITRVAGARALTPMALVILAIGTTDLLFAVDSIPAVFGITSEAYLVFAVNVFALMGLRQLYFLLQGTLNRVTYLNRGLAVILAFIGVKLLLEALHGTLWPAAPEVPVWMSLVVIVSVLIGTALVSVVMTAKPGGDKGTS